MPAHLGPIEIVCDAPPYPIVRACTRLGLVRPLDVRWCRTPLLRGSWVGTTCSCGQPLPALIEALFELRDMQEYRCWLGQCRGCRTIYWGEA
jgi:hypothetical protein